jgi:hypothetical protein
MMPGMTFAREEMVARARSIAIEDELGLRGIRLKRIAQHEQAGPCPMCAGTDRFAINLQKQLWLCRGCRKGGDIVDLVKHLDGLNFLDACRLLAGEPSNLPGFPTRSPALRPAPRNQRDNVTLKPDDEARRNRALALNLWAEASPLGVTLADRYLLFTRKLDVPTELLDGEVLRFHPSCPYGEKTRHPCLLALWRDIRTDEPRAITRTALTPEAKKIGRMSLGPTAGAAIKLTPDVDVSYGLTIGEGVETTIAGMLEGFRPAWVVGNSGIRHFPVLAGIDALTILIDNDEPDQHGRRAGPDAAAICAERWTSAGREVLLVKPNKPDTDMADLAQGGRHD